MVKRHIFKQQQQKSHSQAEPTPKSWCWFSVPRNPITSSLLQDWNTVLAAPSSSLRSGRIRESKLCPATLEHICCPDRGRRGRSPTNSPWSFTGTTSKRFPSIALSGRITGQFQYQHNGKLKERWLQIVVIPTHFSCSRLGTMLFSLFKAL